MVFFTRIAGLVWAVSLSIGPVRCQSVEEGDDIIMLTGTRSDATKSSTGIPSGVYQTPSSRVTLATTSLPTDLGPLTANMTEMNTVTYLTGSVASSATTITADTNGTSTSTSATAAAPPQPTNTRPCNNYPELCARKYSNITQVGCHNSPFVRAGSAAANQQFPVLDQLNDGVRFLQGQMQWPSDAPASSPAHFCHTSCDLLDAGPITDWLTQVRDWVAAHPYDVVTILLGNGNYSTPDKYVGAIEASGITQYVYTPAVVPLRLDDWPTLGQLILSGQRVVMFLDYMANQTAYPWLLDEFTHMWETPFDPVDDAFPCTVQRPPDLAADAARDRLYLMNHNLNAEVSLLGSSIVVPAVSQLNVTNAAEGPGSLGLAANNCRSDWGRAPNVLNVDYYNFGNYPGSVFEVAARMNNVSFEKRSCCGLGASAGVRVGVMRSFVWIGLACMVWVAV
ncbi:PLC-like phosphodiesterase [Parathielavia hyrcaniae]|uniref:PLC-like phosphodiesterase n=1 Tax=Parathielavia hyrcaniae TaxID=113614 RepID=A0AAN6QB58_9PEZI|nr:PLC-like phosphodiesterase [Parathielavia hyrcaniae]